MKTVIVRDEDTKEVIASIEENASEITGIAQDGYEVIVNGEMLEKALPD